MKRRDFITLLGITLLGGVASAWPLAARAQGGKVSESACSTRYRQHRSLPISPPSSKVCGTAVAISKGKICSADGQQERFQLAADLVDLNVIVTRGTPAALAAKNATSTIPIVMAGSRSARPLGKSRPRSSPQAAALSSWSCKRV